MRAATAVAVLTGLAGLCAGALAGRAAVEPARRRADRAAHTDPLTGLANRAGLVAAFDQDDAVLFALDLDKFKAVNDTYGHAAGDEVLREVARRLLAAVPAGSVVARLGGDEFAALVEVVDQDQAEAIGRRIVAELAEPMSIEGHELAAPASVGMAPAVSWEWSSRAADKASYRAKRDGSGLAVYSDDPDAGDGPVTITERPAVRTRDRRMLPARLFGRRSDYGRAA